MTIYRRIMAFLIDILLVTVVASALCEIPSINPYLDEYESATVEYEEAYENYLNGVESGGSYDYLEDMNILINISKKIEKYKTYEVIYFIIFFLLYNVVFQYFNNGMTVGKRLFKLKVVTKDDKKASIIDLFIRSMFNGSSIAYGVTIIALLRSLTTLINSTSTFYLLYIIITLIGFAYEVSMLIILIKTKGIKSTHDLITGTKVISFK